MFHGKLNSHEDTLSLARFLYENREGCSVFLLNGPMGSGKTYFTKALFTAMGGESEAICSPTYTYLMIHPTPLLTLFHLDLYRLEGNADFLDIGGGDLFSQEGIIVMEWAERLGQNLPNSLEITLDYGETENTRTFWIKNPTASMTTYRSQLGNLLNAF